MCLFSWRKTKQRTSFLLNLVIKLSKNDKEKIMPAQLIIGRRCPKTPENPVGWEDIPLQDIKFDKPTVLCLSGDGTLTARDANAMAKYAERLLGRIGLEGQRDIQILSAYYRNANAREMTNSRLCHTEADKSHFSEEERNPSYIFDFYEQCLRKITRQKNGRKREISEACRLMRNLNVLAFCHGDYVTCKLNEIMNEDMKRLGYTSGETDAVARQAAVISVVPQDNLKKSSFTKIGFVSLDDYHYASDDASNLTDYYELDCCENSCFGIIEREKEARKGRSRLFYIDNLLDYNSIEDKFSVWMGKTEKLHQMNAYIDLDYQNEFGTKSENGRNFGRMISRALQNAVSNSCRNYRSRELIELKTDDIFITEPAGFRQGNEQQNQGYISPQVENAVAEAQRRGAKTDSCLCPSQTQISAFPHMRD